VCTENITADIDLRRSLLGASLLSVPVVIGCFYLYGLTLLGVAWACFGAGLVLLALIDAKTQLLPDALTLPLMWAGIVLQLFPQTRTVGLEASIWGVVFGYLPLWILAHAYWLIRKREGLGFGDLKLLAAMGAWSGPMVIPGVVFLASLLAIAGVVVIRLTGKRPVGLTEAFPFGPWIILAYMLSVTFGIMMPLHL
jgi:prepilin signal peptidase PulO-like enzyme (type II secretory pathway)